ncbi:MAG TPA: AmmeMemoRadiSam system protein B [Terriglobales bacterium]|jgi:MEMO1 family protein|nr:AmmeMemoRadiSam system protein B [Terriglobales bacterium]
MVRESVVAGKFYSANPDVLRSDLSSYLSPAHERVFAIGCVAPHAGYIYSGRVAGAVFSSIQIPTRCIVICPNHTGRGHPLAVMAEGKWSTPLGEVAIDTDLAARLLKSCPALADDAAAHRFEHAIEVELPFLQTLCPALQIVPVAVGTSRLLLLEELGSALGEVVRSSPREVLMVASSDMNHYEDDETTRMKDHKAIRTILDLDPQGLYQTVMNESISMCGFGPAVAMLTAAKLLGATKAELVQYATSAETSGDKEMCVGYAGIVVR